VSSEAVKAGAEEANRLGLPVTCHCLDVFLAAEAGFAGVEHHWAPGMTSIADVKKRWEVHELRMTGKINTADVAFYYKPENFDKVIKAMVEKKVSWSPTIATWFRPLSPSAERFKETELSILNNPRAAYLPAVMREQPLDSMIAMQIFPPIGLSVLARATTRLTISSSGSQKAAVSSERDRTRITACRDLESMKKWSCS